MFFDPGQKITLWSFVLVLVSAVNGGICNGFFFFFSFFQVIRHFDGCKADLVVCDGAPDGYAHNFFMFSDCTACYLVSNKYTYPNTELAFFQVDLQLPDSMTWMNLFSRNSFWR